MPSTSPPSTLHYRTPAGKTKGTRTYVIYFITGNPGLIGYYTTFLSHLFALLTSANGPLASTDILITGRSLSGFSVSGALRDTAAVGSPPFTVAQQLDHSEAHIRRVVDGVREESVGRDVRVILMGHSLGTYMTLELVRRLSEEIRIVGGICLFATVMELAKSASGVKFSYIVAIPQFDLWVSWLSYILFSFLPRSFLKMLVRIVTSCPPDAAAVTAAFLQSPHGVRQALFMARDEMTEISTDKWGEEVWGTAAAVGRGASGSRLKFLFAKKDHWLSDQTRDELIRLRGRRITRDTDTDTRDEEHSWKPEMEVDETQGWVHGFCLEQSVPVAERVSEWVKSIILGDLVTRE